MLAAAACPASVSFHATQWPCPGMTVPKSFSAPQPLGLSFRPLRGFDDSRPIFWSIRSRATGLNLFQAHESPPTVFPVAKSIFKGKALRAFEMFAVSFQGYLPAPRLDVLVSSVFLNLCFQANTKPVAVKGVPPWKFLWVAVKGLPPWKFLWARLFVTNRIGLESSTGAAVQSGCIW